MAAIAPGAVAFQIHQVVPAFQISSAKYENQKKREVVFSWSAINNIGIQAKKIRNVKGETGHAATSKTPAIMLSIKDRDFFKQEFL